MQEEKVELEYNENVPPPHKLETHNFGDFELHQEAGKKLPSQGLVIRYDPDNQFAAIGCRNGEKLVYNVEERRIIEKFMSTNNNSVTTLKWRPMTNSTFKTLVTADSEGQLEYWHIPSLKKLFALREHQNTINTIDFNRTGSLFATAGKDCNIRIYDEETKSQSTLLKKADWNHTGHDNRVFAVKFIEDKILLSGGWDSVIHVWDIRVGKSIKHMYGSNLSGEALDYQDGKILAGCYSVKNQIQIWDFNTGARAETIDWTQDSDVSAYVYAAGYSKYDIGMIGAGSTGAESSVKIFKDTKNTGKHEMINEVRGVNEGCFSFDFSHRKSQFAFTTAHHGFYVYDIKKKQ